MSDKLLSVITVCYNSEKTVAKTVRSIVEQMTEEVEYVLIDGASKDRTVELIREAAQGTEIKLISEPDKGIYDAMNKGIANSTGKWLLFMNSDDCLKPGILNKMLPKLKEYSGYGCICTDVELIRVVEGKKYSKVWSCEEISNNIKWHMTASHQGMYMSREAMEKVGNYDTSFPIVGDWEILYRIYEGGYPVGCIHETTAEFLEGGASGQQMVWEKHRVRKKNHMYRIIDLGLCVDAFVRLKAEVATLILGDKKKLIVAKKSYTEIKE